MALLAPVALELFVIANVPAIEPLPVTEILVAENTVAVVGPKVVWP